MGEEKLGLWGATSISVGGMIGGGVFAVLGVVARIAGGAAWLAFTLACLVSMCAAYSYLKLNSLGENRGGSVSQFEEYVENPTVAGMVGWTLLFGYVGAMAMYAYAFGSFAVALTPAAWLSAAPMGEALFRPTYSVLAVGLFVGLNVLGAQATGTSEVALVVVKVAVLLAFGLLGLGYALTTVGSGVGGTSVELGLSYITDVSPVVMATAVSFVSFQGWQLLMYDQDSIRNPEENLPKAVYWSILITIVIDGLIAVIVTSLAPFDAIAAHPERALAIAVEPVVGGVGFLVVSVAAVFSTGSAINGTLFSSANFAKRMLSDGLLPDTVGRAGADGAPTRTVVVLGALAAAFSALGGLDAITSFGSLSFIAVFGAMCFLAFRERDEDDVNGVVPALGVLGTAGAFALLLYSRFRRQPDVFWAVLGIAVVVLLVELLYFKGSLVEKHVPGVAAEEDHV
jgi:amino acid transporter